jgi:hypothetical protein
MVAKAEQLLANILVRMGRLSRGVRNKIIAKFYRDLDFQDTTFLYSFLFFSLFFPSLFLF